MSPAVRRARSRATLARLEDIPNILDVFIAAVRYMEGAPARPWYRYTAERKRALAASAKSGSATARA